MRLSAAPPGRFSGILDELGNDPSDGGDVEHRSIGGLSVSVVGLGCNNFGRRIDANESAAAVEAALDAGINYFDTADVYGDGLSEEYLGRALRGRRDDVVIATKFGAPGSADEGVARGSAAWVRTALERSLRRLSTDRIDHYQLHFPDPEVPIEARTSDLHGSVRRAASPQSADGPRFAPCRTGTARFIAGPNPRSSPRASSSGSV
jgi:hypothetical protein